MNEILFRGDEHKSFFSALLKSMGVSEHDVYRRALAYLIALDADCRKHVFSIYDFENDCIIPDALEAEWITGGSRRTLELAFNLYNGYCGADAVDIFSYGDYNVYYVQALKIRFPSACWAGR